MISREARTDGMSLYAGLAGSVFILKEASMALTHKQIRAAARRVLLAGVWMIEKDHGRLRLLPYVSPSGCHYRVELHLEGKPSSPLFRYSTADGHRYMANHGGARVPWNAGPATLAAHICAGCRDLATVLETFGPLDPEYARWLSHLKAEVERDRLPVAIADYEDLSRWWRLDCADGANRTIAVPPGYIEPGEDLEVEGRSA